MEFCTNVPRARSISTFIGSTEIAIIQRWFCKMFQCQRVYRFDCAGSQTKESRVTKIQSFLAYSFSVICMHQRIQEDTENLEAHLNHLLREWLLVQRWLGRVGIRLVPVLMQALCSGRIACWNSHRVCHAASGA